MSLSTSNSNAASMSGKRYVLLLLLSVGVLVSGIYLVGLGIDLEDTMAPEDYLAKLNDRATFGVKNSIRVNPRILVIGDSHAYAGINFNMLADGMGTQRIATCTLGSLFIETALFALEHYESLGELPKTVILCTSTRQFWEEKNKREMIFSHKTQINGINSSDLMFSVQNILAYISKEHEGAYADLQRRLTKHTPLVEAMSELNIAAVLERSAHESKHTSNWLRRIQEAEFTSDSEAYIRSIGELVVRNDIDFYVVAIPESPWLEQKYPEWIRDKYLSLLNAFKPFARAVLNYNSEDVGLGNRHFINRSMQSNYDYEKWNEPDYSDSSDIDADHIGFVGAVLFTEVVVKDILKAKNDE